MLKTCLSRALTYYRKNEYCSHSPMFIDSQGIALTPTSTGQLQFPLINMSTLKAHLDKNVKPEPTSPQYKGGTTTMTVTAPQPAAPSTTVTIPAGVSFVVIIHKVEPISHLFSDYGDQD